MLWSFLAFVLSQWTLLAAVCIYFLYRRITRPFQYFADRGIVYAKPLGSFVRLFDLILQRVSIYDLILNDYNKFKGKRFVGAFEFTRPFFSIRDPDLIRQITVKDFEYFTDHRSFLVNPEPLFGKSLIMLTGQRWRDMRATLSPAFTGSKMRHMFQLVVDCADQATQILVADANSSSKPFVPEMKDLFTRLTNDVIATTAFGIQVDSLKDRSNEFYMMGKSLTQFSSIKVLAKMLLMMALPKLSAAFGVRMFDKKQTDFYHSLVHDTIGQREREGIVRPDMIHLLMQARKGALKAGDEAAPFGADDAGFATVDEVKADALHGEQKLQWDDDELTAQCFLFFVAGFETSATLLCFAAHELMENRAVQLRLIEELDAAKEQLAGKPLTYDALQKLKYLDQVVSETLRKWPPAIAMDRLCQKDYQMADETGNVVTIEKGKAIVIPMLAIHRDPEYYAEPDRFDPERFSDEHKSEILPFTYMPFGLGPRNCIGSRFALMECKAILFYLLTTFTFEVAETSSVPLVFSKGFQLAPKNGFNIHLKPRS